MGPLLRPALPQSYLGYVVRCYGKEIDLVSQPLGSLHCGDVGVDQQSLDVFFLQGLNRLEGQKWPISLARKNQTINGLRPPACLFFSPSLCSQSLITNSFSSAPHLSTRSPNLLVHSLPTTNVHASALSRLPIPEGHTRRGTGTDTLYLRA